MINTLSNLLVLNFEAVTWNYNLPPDRPESLGTLNNFASSPAQYRPHAYIRAQKLARGAHMNKLIERAASTPSFSTQLERSASMTPLQQKSRVSSAPVNVTRQVTQSIEQHVLRLHQARQRNGNEVECQVKPRPQSSPAHLRTYAKNRTTNNSSGLTLEGSFIDKERMKTPGNVLDIRFRHHSMTRRHFASVRETSSKHHGWITSAADNVVLSHNKLMPTAEQAREHVKRRPQTADLVKVKTIDSTIHHASSKIPQTASGLNLRTYSEHLEPMTANQTNWPRKKRAINKTQRPLSCLT